MISQTKPVLQMGIPLFIKANRKPLKTCYDKYTTRYHQYLLIVTIDDRCISLHHSKVLNSKAVAGRRYQLVTIANICRSGIGLGSSISSALTSCCIEFACVLMFAIQNHMLACYIYIYNQSKSIKITTYFQDLALWLRWYLTIYYPSN